MNNKFSIQQLINIKLLCLLMLSLLFSCTTPNKEEGTTTKETEKNTEQKVEKKLLVLATTSMIGDALNNVAGDKVEVVSLMGAGVDPHLYKATPKDVRMLQDADMIFYNGLYLESKFEEILEKLAKKKTVVSVGESLPEESKIKLGEEYDPHIWFDVENWIHVVEKITQVMKEKDEKNAATYQKNGEVYREELKKLHESNKTAFQSIPEDQRILITSHDAFSYLAKAYDIEVRGLQGISTSAEFGLKDVQELAQFITDKKIKSVFVESSVSAKGMEAVIQGCKKRGHNVINGGELLADAMGKVGTPEGTYIGMVKHNVNKIIKGLK